MRTLSLRAVALLLLSGLSACSSNKPADGAVAVYLQVDAGVKRLFAVPEDGKTPPVALSPAGARAVFGASLSGRRVLYATLAADASVTSVRRVSTDGSGEALLAEFPAGKYVSLRGAWEAEGRAIVQLTNPDGTPDLFASAGNALVRIAGGRYVGAAAGRIVYLANNTSAVSKTGDVRSVKLDGSGDLALGGGDADDTFHGLAGSTVLLTEHATGAAEVHAVSADGSGRKSRAGSKGVLFASGALVASRSGALERLGRDLSATALNFPEGAATALALRADGTVFAHVAGQGVLAADGRSVRTLDAFATNTALAAQLVSFPAGERLVYTANNDEGSYLRVAPLDGSAASTLAEGHYQEVLFSGLHAGRALFFRTAGAEIGGRLSTVGLDGQGERPVGDLVTRTATAADHDFGGLSKAGRLFFEAEIVEHAPPRLFVVEPSGAVRALTAAAGYTSLSALVE